jgi:hypothetical protein
VHVEYTSVPPTFKRCTAVHNNRFCCIVNQVQLLLSHTCTATRPITSASDVLLTSSLNNGVVGLYVRILCPNLGRRPSAEQDGSNSTLSKLSAAKMPANNLPAVSSVLPHAFSAS